MKNINVEYDMDKNDLDIILRDIVKENKKKPSLAFIVENYPTLLSILCFSLIFVCLCLSTHRLALGTRAEVVQRRPIEGVF